MHPADQFEAFKALVDEGRPIEDIAADFGVTPLVVQRRLKLAKVSPRLLAAYRQDDVPLEQLMALAIPDDQTADRRRVVWGKSVTVRVEIRGGGFITKKKKIN